MRTSPAVKKLFYHSWWVDALIILGLLTFLFILLKLSYKAYKAIRRRYNKRNPNNLDNAPQESAQTALNRVHNAIRMDTLEPPIIMGMGDGTDSPFNMSGIDGPLTATDNDDNNNNNNNDNLPTFKDAMQTVTAQQIVHELNKSQEIQNMIQQTIQNTLQEQIEQTLSPRINAALNSQHTLSIDDLEFAFNQYSDETDAISQNGNNNINNNNIANVSSGRHTGNTSVNSVGSNQQLQLVGNPSALSYATDLTQDNIDEKDDCKNEEQLANLMSDVEGLFSKLKDIGSDGKEIHEHEKSEFGTPYHTDSDDDDGPPPGDFRSSLKLAGMSSIVLDKLESRNVSRDLRGFSNDIKHIVETAGRTDMMEETNINTDGEGEDDDNDNDNDGLDRKGHNKGVRFDVPFREDITTTTNMATVPETMSDDGDDEDEDDEGLVYVDDVDKVKL